MKAKDLRERPTDDLVELESTMTKDLFSYRMKNFTSQLDDTSLIGKTTPGHCADRADPARAAAQRKSEGGES